MSVHKKAAKAKVQQKTIKEIILGLINENEYEDAFLMIMYEASKLFPDGKCDIKTIYSLLNSYIQYAGRAVLLEIELNHLQQSLIDKKLIAWND